jgi:ribose-phosphate pyrophosphokinase
MKDNDSGLDELVERITNSPVLLNRISKEIEKDRLEVVAVYDDSKLSQDIAQHLGKELVPVKWGEYDDGEVKPEVLKNLNRKDVYVLAHLKPKPLYLSDGIIRTELLIEALKETCNVNRVSLLTPIHPYQAQDKTHSRREPKSARWIARTWQNLLGVSHLIANELHSGQIESLYKSMDNLHFAPIIAHYVQDRYLNGESHVAGILPDPSAGHLVDEFLVNFQKEGPRRATADQVRDWDQNYKKKIYNITGDPVDGMVCLMLDDMIRSGGTMFGAAYKLVEQNPEVILAAACHAFGFASKDYGPFEEALLNSPIQEVITTNTNPVFVEKVLNDERLQRKVTILDIAPYQAAAIIARQTGDTVRELIKTTPDIGTMYNELHRATDTL